MTMVAKTIHDFVFPQNVLVGFEVEFCFPILETACSEETSRMVRYFGLDNPLEKWFVLGTDMSLQPRNRADTLEMRLAQPTNVVSIESLRCLSQSLKAKKAFTTRHCGFHVHLSHPRVESAEKMWSSCLSIVPTMCGSIFRERRHYCDPTFRVRDKYNAMRWVSSEHFEIRIFNGTIKFRGLRHYLRLVHEAVCKALA